MQFSAAVKPPLAPIAIFVYSRPDHTRRMIESLKLNPEFEQSDVTVYCDGAKGRKDIQGVAKTREVVRELLPNVRIVEQPKNRGLANSIIAGVSDLCATHGRAIIVEDDLILTPFALNYFNNALDRYAHDDRVMHISGYMFPVEKILPPAFFYREATCWGWATWDRAWRKFNPDADAVRALIDERHARGAFDVNDTMYFYEMLVRQCEGKLDSWAIRWYGSMFLNNGLALHPGRSLVANEGFDGSGIHSNTTVEFRVGLASEPFDSARFPSEIKEDANAVGAMMAHRQSKHETQGLVPRPVQSAAFTLMGDLLDRMNISPVLVDVGCSGEEQAIWRQLIPQSTVVAFDPDERSIPGGLYAAAKRFVMVNKAVAAREDVTKIDFILTRYPSCSSTLEPNLAVLADWSFRDLFTPERRVSAPAISLNAALAQNGLSVADWIKVDSQGTDLRIIQSLKPEFLQNVLAVNVEPGLINAYEGEDLFWSVHRYMTESGFWLANINLQQYARVSPEALNSLAELSGSKRAEQVKNVLRKSPTAAEALYLRSPSWLQGSFDLRRAVVLFAFTMADDHVGAAFKIARRVQEVDASTATVMREICRLRIVELQALQLEESSLVRKFAKRISRSAKYRSAALARKLAGKLPDGPISMTKLAAMLGARRGVRVVRRLLGSGNDGAATVLHQPTLSVPKWSLGTHYGGHTVATQGLSAESIVYSYGVGEDASFDLGLIENYGCEIYAFDPTPKSVVWTQNNVSDPRFHFEAIGIAAQDGNVIAKKPDNPNYVSHSKIAQGMKLASDDTVDFAVERLSTTRKRLGHSRIDVLKMDIEGFEYDVLSDLLRSGERPAQIAVEFHHGMYSFTAADTRRAVDELTAAGYALFHVAPSGREYSFIKLW